MKDLKKIQKIIEISSGDGQPDNFYCEYCPLNKNEFTSISELATHLIDKHGFQLIHVGQKTDRVKEGLWYDIVITLGI
jgi:hypothetical protein